VGVGWFFLSLIGLGDRASGLHPEYDFQDNIVIIKPQKIIGVSAPESVILEGCPNCASLTLELQHFSPMKRQLIGFIHIDIPNNVK
jgi:hypothetical protein